MSRTGNEGSQNVAHPLASYAETNSRHTPQLQIEVKGDVRSPGEFVFHREADVFHYLNFPFA